MFSLPNLQIYPLKHDPISKGGEFEAIAEKMTAIKDVAAHALEKLIRGDVGASPDHTNHSSDNEFTSFKSKHSNDTDLSTDRQTYKHHNLKNAAHCERVPETLNYTSDVDTSLESCSANRWETTTDAGESVTHDASIEGNSTETENNDHVQSILLRLSEAEIRLKLQRRKHMKVISYLNKHNQRLEEELLHERMKRSIEFTKIVKSLLWFEAKLKHDKKGINEKLFEKDNEICKLLIANKILRQKLGEEDSNEVLANSHKEAQYCLQCRRDYYGIEGIDVSTQTVNANTGIKEHPTENGGSSSDETLSTSFSGARRSVRYTSKRSFGSFRDYLKSRSMTIDDPSLDNCDDKGSVLSYEESNYSYDGGDLHLFSKRIDQMHGVKSVHFCERSNEDANNKLCCDEQNNNSECDLKEEGCSENRSTNCKFKEFSEDSPKQEFELSTDDWYASASDVEDGDSVCVKPYGCNAVNPVLECVNQILLQQSMEEAMADGPPSLESYENNGNNRISAMHKEHNVSVRKRVHFSTKNSMVHVPRDDSISEKSMISCSDQQKDCYESIYSNEYEPIGSEQNSSNLYVDMESKLGHDDVAKTKHTALKSKQPPALPPKPANLIKFKRVLRNGTNLQCQSMNENKVTKAPSTIGTESEPDYCSISEVNESMSNLQVVAADVHKSADDDAMSCCSDKASQKTGTEDSEGIFADIPKLPNVAAIIAPKAINKFVNQENYITKSPSKDDETNNKELNGNSSTTSCNKSIINDSLCISDNSNLQTKSSAIVPDSLQTQKTTLPRNLGELPKKTPPASVFQMSPSKASIVSLSPNKIKQSQSVKACLTSAAALSNSMNLSDDKLPLEAEFDWYNLDAEYNKLNQPDVIKETDVVCDLDNEITIANEIGIDHNSNSQPSVEYNLDEEFSLINQPDIIKENVLEPKISSSSTSSSPSTITTVGTVCTRFPTIVDQTPCCNQSKAKAKKNFTNFIDNSGLSTKPLPRQRKIYFSGPFV